MAPKFMWVCLKMGPILPKWIQMDPNGPFTGKIHEDYDENHKILGFSSEFSDKASRPCPPVCGFAPGRDTRGQLAGGLPSAHATGCHGLGEGQGGGQGAKGCCAGYLPINIEKVGRITWAFFMIIIND